tara:strand:- start:1666 stop:1923 length:258 start_codon:yes stop_codon:yes gene_type:complete
MTKLNPTIEYIDGLDKWGKEYCRIYQRLYQRKRKGIISEDQTLLFELMKKTNSQIRPTYNRLEYNKGDKIVKLNIEHKKIVLDFN